MAKSLMPDVKAVASRAMQSVKGGYGGDEEKKKGKGKAKGAVRAKPEPSAARTRAKAKKDKAEEKPKSPSALAGRSQAGDESRGSSRGGVGFRTGPGRGDTVTRPGG